VDTQLKSIDCIRGLLQPNYVYFQLHVSGASRQEAIDAIQRCDTVLSFPQIDQAIFRHSLLDQDEPCTTLVPAIRQLVRENRD